MIFKCRVGNEWIFSVGDTLCLVDIILVTIESVDGRAKTFLHDVGLDHYFILIPSIVDSLEQSLLAVKDIKTFGRANLKLFHDEPGWHYASLQVLLPRLCGLRVSVEALRLEGVAHESIDKGFDLLRI